MFQNHHETCPHQKFPREAVFGGLGWTKPWETWAEFSVVLALSRWLNQKFPDVPSNLNCFGKKSPVAVFHHLKNKWPDF